MKQLIKEMKGRQLILHLNQQEKKIKIKMIVDATTLTMNLICLSYKKCFGANLRQAMS